MASLPCKLAGQVAFKARGDVFHTIRTKNIAHLTKIAPSKVQTCNLCQGNFGTVGSILEWTYIIEGKEQTCKQVVESIDEEKRQATYRFIEGDLLQLYKNFKVDYHVETKAGIDYITWTIHYELLSPENPHPISVL